MKQDFGLGHYEGRGWRGFHHHATLSIAAYVFLMAQRLKTGSSDAGGKKTSPNAKCLQFPRITSLGAVPRAASRAGLDYDAVPAPERRTRKRPGTLPALQLDKPKITFVTQ